MSRHQPRSPPLFSGVRFTSTLPVTGQQWIKQNLRIKHFFGTSDNAVKTQVWIAICIYVLVAIVRKELRLELSLSQILQVLSVNAFEQVPLAELIANAQSQDEAPSQCNQLMLWD